MTPIRRQYLRIKAKYPQAIVFFRLGDFYETFDEDAKVTARELEITLTSREMGKGQRVPMAGIPYHALDSYLSRLIHKGYKVAICEQLSEPGKGLVERDVVRVVTPGTVVEPHLLDTKANNYLVALVAEGEEAGLASVDITTSEFATTQLPAAQVAPELERLRPAEVLLPSGGKASGRGFPASLTRLDEVWFELETATELLKSHFGVSTLEGYGCAHLPLATRAAGAILHYLAETHKEVLSQLTRLTTYSTAAYMILDAASRRTLEIFPSGREDTAAPSLLSVLDLTRTAMGGRLLRRWLNQPLLDITKLTERQEAIAAFYQDALLRGKVVAQLSHIADLERLVNRARGGLASPREVITLRRSLESVAQLRAFLEEEKAGEAAPLHKLTAELKPCPDLVASIGQALVEEPPTTPGEGLVKEGFSPELDHLCSASRHARQYLADLERQERERTGIKSLKVGYNKVFGYYIEVSNPNLSQVPADYIRKQTLVGAERFFTPQLKEYESLILNAEDRLAELEATIFRQLCRQIGEAAEMILGTAAALAQLDVFTALAEMATRYHYVRPTLTQEDAIIIKGGRHPVVERALQEERFVPNDTYLSNRDCQVVILTGPNMSGKSTYLRQVALIVLLGQIGSFVPAEEATLGLVDRIFTRIGLHDDLALGRSTFMVEMVETASILNQATPRSLIILDEIGRGTSTYDGLSLAWAVAEYLHHHPKLGAKTLFATHYHELTELAQFLPRVKNYNVAVAQEGGQVIFLRQIVPGGADRSYGLHVAQLAGLPRPVLQRAQEILTELEEGQRRKGPSPLQRKGRRPAEVATQLPLLGQSSPLLEELSKLELDSMTPFEALTKLYELQKKAKDGLTAL